MNLNLFNKKQIKPKLQALNARKPLFISNITNKIHKFLKVNLAGEHAAVIIYESQLNYLKQYKEKTSSSSSDQNLSLKLSNINTNIESDIDSDIESGLDIDLDTESDINLNTESDIDLNTLKQNTYNQKNKIKQSISELERDLLAEKNHLQYFEQFFLNAKYHSIFNFKPSILMQAWSILTKKLAKSNLIICNKIFSDLPLGVHVTSSGVESIVIKHYKQQILECKKIIELLSYFDKFILQDKLKDNKKNQNTKNINNHQTNLNNQDTEDEEGEDTEDEKENIENEGEVLSKQYEEALLKQYESKIAYLQKYIKNLSENINQFLDDEILHFKHARDYIDKHNINNTYNKTKNPFLFNNILFSNKQNILIKLEKITAFVCKIGINLSAKF